MNTTSTTAERLEDILRTYAGGLFADIHPQALKEAIAAIEQLLVEARLDELERLGDYKGNYSGSQLGYDIEDRIDALTRPEGQA